MTRLVRSARRRARRRSVRGNVALIVALLAVVLCGFAAVAVDVGNMYRVRSQTRAGLDAAALAAASGLDGTTNGLNTARTRAISQGAQHRVYQTNLQLTPEEIEFGRWTTAAGFRAEPSIDLTNAVRLTHTTPAVAHPFGAVIGRRTSAIGAQAVAVGGGPISAPCAFPLVVPECALTQATAGNNCGYCMQMQDANNDSAGWTVFDNGAVNPPNIRDAVRAACAAVTPDGICGPNCSNQSSEDRTISLNNGNLMNTGNNNFCPVIKDILMRNGSPESFRVTVPVLRTGPMSPCNPSFSGSGQVAGFAELTIFGASCSNSDTPVIAPNPTPSVACSPPSGKFLLATLDCRTRINAPGGGAFFGLQARPRLVQ